MTDEVHDFSDDPEFNPTEPIEKDHRGSVMGELESWERIIDGLKMAADASRHMARFRFPDKWNTLAQYLDSIRKAVIRDGGFDRPADATDSAQQFGGDGMAWTMASRRIADGLKMAASGADQIALCQRSDLRWVNYAQRLRTLRDTAHKLAMKTSQRVTDQGWRNTGSGLVVPSRLH